MMNHTALKETQHAFWTKEPTEWSGALNSFVGPFALSDHDLVPELIRDLVLSQRNEDKFTRIPMSAVNDIANKFWEGPGSCAAIQDVIWHARIARSYGATFTESKGAYKLGYTVDEWIAINEERK